MNYLSQEKSELFQGKRVLLRLDLNVPVGSDDTVHESDAHRIHASRATIDWLTTAGARVIIVSHIGRDPQETLSPVAQFMNIPLVPLFGNVQEASQEHQVILLENLRSDSREELCDTEFSQTLASYADYYVNDAFAVSHRAHASVVGIPRHLPSYAGLQFEQEIKNLEKVTHPEHPAILIMGGAKFETKLPVIQNLLPLFDYVFIGGALVNNFYKEKGYEVGKSLIDQEAKLGDLVNNPKIVLPDMVELYPSPAKERGASEGSGERFAGVGMVSPEDRIIDVVIPDSFKEILKSAKTIIWNGPMGNYENGFTQGTESLVHAVSESQGFSLVGGGDSVALIEQLGLTEKFGFLSTGGGAMLEYLAQGTLPGIEALE